MSDDDKKNGKRNDNKSGEQNGNKNGKKNGEQRNRVSLWSVTIKYWTLVVWVLAAFLLVWTALFVASYDFSRYTGGDAIIRETPFRAGARFAAALVFLKDYCIFTIPVLTAAGITLALILDAQENTRMTISRWLRKKADEEMREIAKAEGVALGRAEGVALGEAAGRAETNRAWDEWLHRMQEAQRDGKPFDEPPPSSSRR